MMTNNEPSFATLLQDTLSNIQELVRSEVRLAKAEITDKAGKMGKAGAVLGGGIVLALYGLGFLLLSIVYALSLVLAPWLAALITALLVSVIAAVMISVGRNRLQEVHLKPEKTIESVKENVEWAKTRTQ